MELGLARGWGWFFRHSEGGRGWGQCPAPEGGRVGADPDYKGGRVGAVSSKKISHHPQNLFDYICNKVTRQFNLL